MPHHCNSGFSFPTAPFKMFWLMFFLWVRSFDLSQSRSRWFQRHLPTSCRSLSRAVGLLLLYYTVSIISTLPFDLFDVWIRKKYAQTTVLNPSSRLRHWSNAALQYTKLSVCYLSFLDVYQNVAALTLLKRVQNIHASSDDTVSCHRSPM